MATGNHGGSSRGRIKDLHQGSFTCNDPLSLSNSDHPGSQLVSLKLTGDEFLELE